MDNSLVFEDLHFQMGDGNLNYYLYNWVMKCRKINPPQLGVVLFWSIAITHLSFIVISVLKAPIYDAFFFDRAQWM